MTSKKKHILIVDDEPAWLKLMGRTLRDAGYLVKEADSGSAALTALQKYKPDLIVSDLRMPDMNGFDLLDHIKKLPKLSATPVVFLSAIDDFHAKKVAQELGAVACIPKPIDKDEVVSLLKKYLPR
ncbi:MAG: response regulator [Ignavibacteriales bacterium]|nr:response regulator [Ignavibacteriales bacterium]MBI3787077.1 response regulator [Ignavibacteriales bacterium]